MAGDYFIIWCHERRRAGDDEWMDEYESAKKFLDSNDSDDITPEQLITAAEVSLAFPGPVRDLKRSHFDHYAGWVLATLPDQASRAIKEMADSGMYDSRSL